jgi:hypothetical protein
MAFCPNDYGAAGDGSTNDGAAVLATVALGEDVYLKDHNTYLMDGHTIDALSGQRFYGGGTLRMAIRTWGQTPEGPGDFPKLARVFGKTGVKFDGIKFELLAPDEPRSYGLTIQQSADCEVTNCDFNSGLTSCFIWRGSSGTKFIGNRTRGGNFGIATGGDALSGQSPGTISNTTIADNYFYGAISEAIDINWDTIFCTISRNHMSNNRLVNEEEIDIGGGNCRDIIVSDNVIDGGGRAAGGVNVKVNAKYVKIVNNILRNFKSDLQNSAGVTIAYGANDVGVIGNDIYAANKGVWVRSVGGAPTSVTLALNRIANFISYGVHLNGTAAAPLKKVHVIDNKIDGATTGFDGIAGEYSSDGHIRGNVSERNQHGMRFGLGMSGILKDNTLKGNSVASLIGTAIPANWAAGSIISDNVV